MRLIIQQLVAEAINTGLSDSSAFFLSIWNLEKNYLKEFKNVFRASLVAQLVKNLPAIRETWV